MTTCPYCHANVGSLTGRIDDELIVMTAHLVFQHGVELNE